MEVFLPAILKPCTHVASYLLAIGLRSGVQIACDGLQQKFQHAEYFTCGLLISPVFRLYLVCYDVMLISLGRTLPS